MINDLALNTDNRFLVASKEDGPALVWDLDKREPEGVSLGAVVFRVVFSADGKHLAGISNSGVVWVWERASGFGKVVRVFNDVAVNDVAFSPGDSDLLATASDDSIARVWRLTGDLSGDLVKEACSRLTRNLTPKEWSQYMSGREYQRTCSDLP